MAGEGGEEKRSRKSREGIENDEEFERRVRELVDEARRRTAAERNADGGTEARTEGDEPPKASEESEFDRKIRETVEEARERTRRERAEFDQSIREMVDEVRRQNEAEHEERRNPEKDNPGTGDGLSSEETSAEIRQASERLSEEYQSELREKFELEEDKEQVEEEPEEESASSDMSSSESGEVRVEENAGDQQVTVTVEIETEEEPEENADAEVAAEESEVDKTAAADTSQEVLDEHGHEAMGDSGEPDVSEDVRVKEETDEEIEPPDVETTDEEGEDESETEESDTTEDVELSEEVESESPSRVDVEQSEESDVEPDTNASEDISEENTGSPTEDVREREESVQEEETPDERGRLHTTLSSIFPDGGPLRPSMFPETREERLRRLLKEEFEKLPEEEKERLREEAKESLKSNQSLKRYVTAYRESLDEEELEERLKDAEDYVRVKKALEEADNEPDLDELARQLGIDRKRIEELADDDNAPELIRNLWSLEIERRWSRMLRYGTLHEDEGSMERIITMVKDDQEISQSFTVDFWCAEFQAWGEVMRAAHNHEIPFVMVDGEERYRRVSVERLADRLGVSSERVIDWLRGAPPSLIGVGIKQDGFSDIERREDSSWIPSCRLEYEVMLGRHNFYRDQRNFKTLNRSALAYIGLKEMESRRDIEKLTYVEIAKILKTTAARVRYWVPEKKTPRIFKMLGSAESSRAEYEGNLSPEAFEHRIPPEVVYAHLRHLREVKKPTVDELSRAIAEVYLSAEHPRRVLWADMRNISYGGPNWLRRIAKATLREREAIEQELNVRLRLADDPERQLRLGVVNDRLYFRMHDTREQNWMHLYREEIFRFRRRSDKRTLITLARDRLGLVGDRYFSKLIGQITDYNRTVFKSSQNADLNSRAPYLKGATLALILDTLGVGPDTVESRLRRIGRHKHGGIENPRFPKDPYAVDLLFAKLFGTGLSDGHVELKQNGFVYTECDPDRVDIVIASVRPLGDVYYHVAIRENGVRQVRFTSVLGRLLVSRGFPPGDKGMQATRLPRFIRYGSVKIKSCYFRETFCEDGSFSLDELGKRPKFSVTRATTLADPSKQEYDFESCIKDEHIGVIKENGTREDDERFGPRWEMTGGKLKEVAETSATCNEFREIVETNKPQLFQDEIDALASIGVAVKPYLVKITFYEGSGRVSSEWMYSTSRITELMRFVLMCPPNDVTKLEKVKKWVRSRPDLGKPIAEELKSTGYPCYYDELVGEES